MAKPSRDHKGRRRVAPAAQAALHSARDKNLTGTSLVVDPTSLAYAFITFSANPANSSTITLGGTVVTFGTDVAIGANLAATMVTLLSFLTASVNVNIAKATYSMIGAILTVRSKTPNNTTFTLAASAATVSNATLQLNKIRKRKKL